MKKLVLAMVVSVAFAAFANVGTFAKKVTFTVQYDGADTLTGIPVLVKLVANSPVGFTYADCATGGSDIRFADANGNAVPFEIDTWNTSGESLIWVKAPAVTQGTTFTMLFNGTPATTNDPSAVWTEYTGVWHLNELETDETAYSQGSYPNSTASEDLDGHLAQTYSTPSEPGQFGKSFLVNNKAAGPKDDYRYYGGMWVNDAGAESPLDAGTTFTISGWYKHQSWNYYYDNLFSKRSGTLASGFMAQISASKSTTPKIKAYGGNGSATTEQTYPTDQLGTWAYLTFVYSDTSCLLYENGEYVGTAAIAEPVDNDKPLVFGNNVDIVRESGKGDAAWIGWIDELRFLGSAKTEKWIAAEYAAMASETFLAAGEVETIGTPRTANPEFSPGTSVFYPSVTVTLSCQTEGATIYYTTDGSDPTTSSQPYGEPLVLTAATTIKALAAAPGHDQSSIVSATYTNEGIKAPILGEVAVRPKVTRAIVSGTIPEIGNNGATMCNVYISLDEGAEQLIAENVTDEFSAEVEGLTAATDYTYTITIRNNAVTPLEDMASGSFTTYPEVVTPLGTAAETRVLIQDLIDDAAGETPAGTVTLGEGLFEIDAQLMVTNGVTLTGQGWEKTVLKFAGTGNQAESRVATVNGRSTLSRMAVTGANVNSQYMGGGIQITDGTISWCCVTNNVNVTGFGGGIGIMGDANDDIVRIDHTIVAHNAASQYQDSFGGGIGLRAGSKDKTLRVEIDTCLVYGNTVGMEGKKTGYGAGIGLVHKKTADGSTDLEYTTIDIRNTTVVSNAVIGAGTGGGLYTTQKKTTLTNCLFANNVTATNAISNVSVYNSDTVVADVTEKTSNCLFDDVATAFGANAVSGDPLFKNAEAENYRLTIRSPAINKGLPLEDASVDLDGNVRGSCLDIGCYENKNIGFSLIFR